MLFGQNKGGFVRFMPLPLLIQQVLQKFYIELSPSKVLALHLESVLPPIDLSIAAKCPRHLKIYIFIVYHFIFLSFHLEKR